MERYGKIKKRVFEIINKAEDGDLASRIFDWVIMVLILLSILSIILESFAGLYVRWYSLFKIFEAVTVTVFTAEYLLRIWTADLLYPDAGHPRIKYFFSWMAIIDLLAILPFFLPFFTADLRYLRMVRLFRLFRLLRVFKLGRYFEALQIIVKVVRTSGPQLIMSVAICLFVMLLSAIVMYSVENPVQPEQFPNVIASLWWAICTLTTVGYGDVYPVTSVGRLFAAVISFVGIGIIAIPTGIIAAGFNQAIEKKANEDPKYAAVRQALENEPDEEELLVIHAKVTRRLKDLGYLTAKKDD